MVIIYEERYDRCNIEGMTNSGIRDRQDQRDEAF